MRQLIHVPMWHSKDVQQKQNRPLLRGGMGHELSKAPPRGFWTTVDESLTDIDLHGKRPRVYLEGYTGRRRNVPPYIDTSSLEGLILYNFISRTGSIIEPTEDKKALKKVKTNYRLLGRTQIDSAKRARLLDELNNDIDERDDAIAKKIAASLGPEEIGFLFLGFNHDAISRLPADINVTILNDRLRELIEESEPAGMPEGKRRNETENPIGGSVEGKG